MAEDAHSRFVAGLRVSAEHLQHLQDRLRDSLLDLRRAVGLGRIAWGLRIVVGADSIILARGVALSKGGVRLSVDSPVTLEPPAGPGPFRVVLEAQNSDRTALRHDDRATLILATCAVLLEPESESEPDGDDRLVIGRLSADGEGFAASQSEELFIAVGHHRHSGEHRQDAEGNWFYDGPLLAGASGGSGPAGPQGATGLQGAAGPQGDTGPQGETGPAGATGETGPAGAPGAAGATGATGPSGAAGSVGPTGPEGPPGPAGSTGATGAAGPPGTTGATGAAAEPPASQGRPALPALPALPAPLEPPGPPDRRGRPGRPGAPMTSPSWKK
jgi:hypothetical protein